MKKLIIILLIPVFVIISSCSDDDNLVPDWLRPKIAQMEADPVYAGVTVYRHDYKQTQIYNVDAPLRNCIYCEMYDSNGNALNWTEEELNDYLNLRTNEKIIWQRTY